VVSFEGGRVAALSRRDPVQAVITASLGEAILPAAYPVVGTGRWRLMFDIATPAGATIDIRAFLRLGGDSLTETWLAQAFG
jgi:glucans biosynthesis protein